MLGRHKIITEEAMRKLFYVIHSLVKKLFVLFRKNPPAQGVSVSDNTAIVAVAKHDSAPMVIPVAKHDSDPMVICAEPIQIKKPKDKISRPTKSKEVKNYIPDAATYKDFSALMDSLDVVFQSFALPDDKLSWLSKSDAKALRRVGVSVPFPAMRVDYEREDAPTNIDISKPLPTVCCLSFAYKEAIEDGHRDKLITPIVQYAIKCGKLPYNVTQHGGTPYMLGTGYRFNTQSSENDKKENQVNKLWWIHTYAVVSRETGNITFCDELRENTLKIPIRSAADRRNFNHASHKIICRHKWMAPAYLSDRVASVGEVERWAKVLMRQMFDFWAKRSDSWQAAVYDGKNRVTFCVEQSRTKTYFKNRDKTAKASDGKAKRIFHHVDAHTRALNNGIVSSVKEHCRGLREFMWLNYQVKIVAPRFTSEILTSKFDIDPIAMEQDEPMPPNMLDLAGVVQMLIAKEDLDQRAFH